MLATNRFNYGTVVRAQQSNNFSQGTAVKDRRITDWTIARPSLSSKLNSLALVVRPTELLVHFSSYYYYHYPFSVARKRLTAWAVDIILMDIWIQNYIFHIPYNPFCIYGPHKDFYEYISYALFSIVIKLTYKKYSNESHAAILHVQNNYLSKFSTYFPRLCYHTLLQHHIIRFATLIQGSSSSQDPRVVITGCRDSCRKNMQIGGVFRKLKW